ncbi:MAG: c-type cytochrome, partial [Myxococcota bacterium]|nr:c-type cytochrome [Myxococcota bacterium]
MKTKLSILITLLAACGGSASPRSTSRIADPIPMVEGPVATLVADAPADPRGNPPPPAEPARPDPAAAQAQLVAFETAAYERAKPVFEKYCASCHTKGQRGAKAGALKHFEMTTYPFGGHHAAEISGEIREVLAIGGGKPTMPKGKPGSVRGEELALIAAWADAFDAAHAGDAGKAPAGSGGHDPHDHSAPKPSAGDPPARPAP